MGSLLTALASYLQARTQGGRWLLRIDDLDRPRCIAGAEATIRYQLQAHGLLWDEPPRYQSRHVDEYAEALRLLQKQNQAYACGCTRARLATSSLSGPDGPIYDGHCRDLQLAGQHCALRLRVRDGVRSFMDGWQGSQRRYLQEIGDIVLRRADGIFAYQLACAVDEAAQAVSEVVRGADLLGSTFQQMYLQQQLGLASPQYRHLPVLTNAWGRKLSKQNHAQAADPSLAHENLLCCLRWLNQEPPRELERADVREILRWALRHWAPASIPKQLSLAVE